MLKVTYVFMLTLQRALLLNHVTGRIATQRAGLAFVLASPRARGEAMDVLGGAVSWY